MTTIDKAKLWLTDTFDEETKKTIQHWIDTESDELEDSFYRELEFGTGGMRGTGGTGGTHGTDGTDGMRGTDGTGGTSGTGGGSALKNDDEGCRGAVGRNIIGFLPGKNTSGKDKYVIIAAH